MLTKKQTKTLSGSQMITGTALLVLAVLIGFIIHINFSYYWDFLHSDIVADLAFIREAARSFSLFPEGWAHINEMRFIYVTTVAIPFYWITSNVHLAYSLAVSFMLIANVFLFYYMVSFKKRNLLAVVVGAIVFLMLFARYSIFSVFSILFINGTLSTHLATVFLTLGVYLRIKYKAADAFKWEKALWVITLFLAFAQGIQSTRMIIALYGPLFVAEVLPIILNGAKGKTTKVNGQSLIYVVSAFLLNVGGILFIDFLINNGTVVLEEASLTFGLNLVDTDQFIERILQSITMLFNTFGLMGNRELLSIEGLIFILRAGFIFLTLSIYGHLKKEASDRNLVQVLTTTVIFSTLSQALISIGMGERFNFTATAWMAVIFVVVLDHLLEKVKQGQVNKISFHQFLANNLDHKALQKYLVSGLIGIALMGSFLSMNHLGATRNPNLVADRQRVVDFLIAEDLTVGYGAFWQSLAITGVANWDVVVIPFHSNHGVVGQPLRQGVAYNDFFHNDERVFLIGTTSHMEEAYSHHRMGPFLQQGQRYDFSGGWVVYVFDVNPWSEFK